MRWIRRPDEHKFRLSSVEPCNRHTDCAADGSANFLARDVGEFASRNGCSVYCDYDITAVKSNFGAGRKVLRRPVELAALIRTWRDPPSRPSLQDASQGRHSPLRRESQRRFVRQSA